MKIDSLIICGGGSYGSIECKLDNGGTLRVPLEAAQLAPFLPLAHELAAKLVAPLRSETVEAPALLADFTEVPQPADDLPF